MKKVGIIGCGSISQVHCKVIAGMKDAELSVLCDVAEERSAGLKELYLQEKAGQVTDDSNKKKLYDRSEYGGPEDSSIENDVNNPADRIRICTDWHELAGMDLDVVHICTPHFLHVPMAVELLDAGKAVFMEKPCAISEEQFMELKAADERHPGKLGICFQNRYNETTGIIDKAISEGRIGRVIGGRAFVTWRRDEGYYAGSPWKGRIATEGGGALINQSIHTFDLLLRYLGEPKTVRATVSNHHLGKKPDDLENIKIDIEDTVEAWMEFENGVRACFYASNGYAADAPVILEIQGDKGRISMNGSTVILSNEEDGFLVLGSDIPIKNTKAGPSDRMLGQTGAVIKDYWGLGHKACIEDFYRCLDTGRGFAVNLRSVENSFHTMMRIYEKRQGTVLCLQEVDMEQVKLGIIGIGGMGSNHARSLAHGDVPEMKLAAVADIRQERLDWAKDNLPEDVERFSDGRKLIDSGKVDAVLIATPHYFHPEFVIYALEHGVHALSEKPAGVYTKQVREMNEAAAKSDKVFAIMLNQRTNCVYRKLHEMIESGELGQLKRVNWIITDWYRTQSYYDAADWKATWDGEGGGVLLNQCPHQLDLLQWLCGMPKKVRAFCSEAKWHDIEVEDDVTAYLEYENGATGVFVTTTGDAPGTNRLELTFEMGKIVCEHGKLIFDKLSENERTFCMTEKEGFKKPDVERIEIETDGMNEQHTGVFKAFADRILHGGKLVAEGVEGIRGLTLSNAMYLSSWLDRTVEIPFDEDLFLEELNKRRAKSKKKSGSGVVFDTTGTY